MRTMQIGLVWLLIVCLGTPAFAGDLRSSIAKADDEQTRTTRAPIPKGYLWAGSALFIGGMAAGLYGFLNNKNGEFPEFGEADSTNRVLGTAGLITAFAGGAVLFLGSRRASRAPSVTFGPRQVTVSTRVSW